ncbi:SMP-30/gluconolactonase/LRE family protein [[Mycobacterium] kokjensenii]|uniref:SMP-30/gluconolactonase/LRE family protein n=1 Tax=[Mycobacterium] kokjensenii TaxID=3064287 RepID=A0ABM9L7M1_9MYCO|nr:SMP-30/gluconolactonase/LRE family protein [Mycolicibacter sp. MU0083]CAJ1494154.1 SMP-30/gluconolactonase/LRE family protein [Mycolicibacter sp. MU0083]
MTDVVALPREVAGAASIAPGWRLDRVTEPSRLFGANGLRTGPDGRVYVAQVTGSQISALDVASGELAVVSARGGDVVAPDDVAFDADGTLYATEVMDARVSALDASGRSRVLRDDLPCANGITVYQDRLFVGECRDGGRLMELDRATGAQRILAENLPSPNAMEVGPDGLLYFPVMTANEIWRIDPLAADATPQRVAGDLGVPDSVKFGADGFIVSTQAASGQVLRIDPRSGAATVLAQLTPGLDNCTFADGRLFVSNFTGEITEVGAGGATTTVLPGGLNWPLDLTVDATGTLYVADGTYFYAVRDGGRLETQGMLFSPGYPGFIRGVTAVGPGEFVVATSGGQVSRYLPAQATMEVLADGFDQLYGVVAGPAGVAVTEFGTGRVLGLRDGAVQVLAGGLAGPVGIVSDIGAGDGSYLVAESGAGRVVRIGGSGVSPVAEGFVRPQGILLDGRTLYVVDAGTRRVLAVNLESGVRQEIAGGLPIGPPPGVTPKPLRGMPPFSGPQGPFAGIARGHDGTLFVSADGDGSVLALHPVGP